MKYKNFSPSSAPRWAHCPGSVKLSQPYLDIFPKSEAAKEGIAAHWVVEQMGKGKAVEVGGRTNQDVVITEEMVEGARMFLDAIPKTSNLEQKLDCSSLSEGMFGYIDAIDVTDGVMTIADYKFGHSPVEVIENEQLLVEAAASYNNLSGSEKINKIVLMIVQPRFYGGDTVRTWTLTPEELMQQKMPRIQVAIEEVKSENPQVSTGNHCIYCPARHACAVLQNSVLSVVDKVGEAMPRDLNPVALGKELGLLEDSMSLLKARISGLTEMAKVHIDAGKTVAGYVSEAKYGNKKWNKKPEEVFRVADLLGVNVRKDPAPITPGQAIKAGMDPKVVEQLSGSDYKGHELKRVDLNKSKEVFKK